MPKPNRLLDAIGSLKAFDGYSRSLDLSEVSFTPKIQPLEPIQAEIQPTQINNELMPMKVKQVENTLATPTKPYTFKPTSPVPVPESSDATIPLREGQSVFDWNNLEDRRLLLDAQLKAESGYNPKAVSPAGAQGVAQFMPKTWKFYQQKGWVPSDKSPFDVQAALQGQRKYMENMFAKEGIANHSNGEDRLRMAFAGYNAGYGNVLKAKRLAREAGNENDWMQYLPRKEETISYINRIFKIARQNKQNNYNSNFDWGYGQSSNS